MEMLWGRVGRFLRKSPEEKQATIRFFARKGLSKLPYAPIRVRLSVPPGGQVSFWWTYFPPGFLPERRLLDYWGEDIGELRFLWHVLKPGMTFFDIGAYHGIYALVAAKKLGPHGSIVAFEPSVRDRRRLRLHLRLNRLRASVEGYAVSSRSGQSNFYTVVSGCTTTNSLRHPQVQDPVKENRVETITLDEYLHRRAVDTVDVVKVDTEGGELDVLEGAQRTLTRIRPLIICEVLDWVTRPWGYPAREIVTRLREYAYDWFEFGEDGTLSPHLQRDSYPQVRNYLAVPGEKLPAIESWVRA